MTPDQQALREAAERATPGPWTHKHAALGYHDIIIGDRIAYALRQHEDGQGERNAEYICLAHPQAVLALLDRLEAAERRVKELEAP